MPLTLPNRNVLTENQVRDRLSAYQDDCPAVLALYDVTNPGPHDELLPSDLLSINALNAFGRHVFPMTPMTAAWVQRRDIQALITPITRRDFEQLTPAEIESELPLLRDALNRIAHVKGFGDMAASKLLHRLRPNIAPIWGSWVGEWYPESEYKDSWVLWLRRVYADILASENRACLELVRQELPRRLPLQRIWDILLWQLGAHATPADA
jgi:hypothetical protein